MFSRIQAWFHRRQTAAAAAEQAAQAQYEREVLAWLESSAYDDWLLIGEPGQVEPSAS